MKDAKHRVTEAYRESLINARCVIEIMHGEDYKYDLFVFDKNATALIEVYCNHWDYIWEKAKYYSEKHSLEIIDWTENS